MDAAATSRAHPAIWIDEADAVLIVLGAPVVRGAAAHPWSQRSELPRAPTNSATAAA
jgi:hypothetical protein